MLQTRILGFVSYSACCLYVFIAVAAAQSRSATIISPVHTLRFKSHLYGAHVVPPPATPGIGTTLVTLDTLTGAVSVSGSYSGLTSNQVLAHVHSGSSGANGSIVVTLTGTGGTSGTISGSGTLTAGQMTTLRRSGMYVDLHTVSFPLGEIRDQIDGEVRLSTNFDSGQLDNATGQSMLVYERDVQTPDAAWCRAYFSTVELPPRSILRITSLLDGATQDVDRYTAKMWETPGWSGTGRETGSAYFNGDWLLVQLIAGPNTLDNRVALSGIGAQMKTDADCVNLTCPTCLPDGRVLSLEYWSGRLGGECTASVYNEHGCIVTAGHCYGNDGTLLEFDVPLSNSDGSLQHPPPADQFMVIQGSTRGDGTPCYPDFQVGKIGLNMAGTQTHYQRYGVFKPLAIGPPPVSGAVQLFAYGSSSDCVRNGAQQRTSATVTSVFPDVGDRGGHFFNSGGTITGWTSGGGWVHNEHIVGINTCCNGTCSGLASRIDQLGFVYERQQACPSHTVYVPWDYRFCLNDTVVSVPVTVCNMSGAADSYQLSFASVPPGPMCTIAGPSITLVGPNPIGPIPNGQCLTVQVLIGRPSGFTAVGITSCYDVTATSVNTGVAKTDHGSVQDRRDLCGEFLGTGGLVTVGVGRTRRVTLTVRNDGVPSGTIGYRVEAFAPDMEPSGAIALDGQYFGVPSDGVVNIPLNSTGQISFNVHFRWLEPFDVSDIVLSTDLDNNGVREPLMSVGARSLVKRSRFVLYGPIIPAAFSK